MQVQDRNIMRRKAISWIIIVAGLVMAVKTGGNIVRLWKAGKRVNNADVRVEQAKRENEDLKRRLSEVSSGEFVEREARDKLGMAKEGETILILPKQDEATKLPQISPKAGKLPNWRLWWDLYFRPKD